MFARETWPLKISTILTRKDMGMAIWIFFTRFKGSKHLICLEAS